MRDPQDNLRESNGSDSHVAKQNSLPQICDEFEQRLRAGEPVRCEGVFAERPWLVDDSELALDVIYTEFNVRRDLGQFPTQQEFYNRFPQWRSELSHQFQLDELLVDSPTIFDEAPSETAPSERLSNLDRDQRFRPLGEVANGALGQVARALDTQLDREVAVKSIQPYLVGNGSVRQRFIREAEITGRLEHPGIVPVYAMGVGADGIPFYAMRLIRGQNLQEAIDEFHSRFKPQQRFSSIEFMNLLRRFLSVCETIAYAHSRGVIHRDIKPQNIMLGPFGETLVVDWGLAKTTSPDDPSSKTVIKAEEVVETPHPDENNSSNASSLDEGSNSRTGKALIGTPAFMSPEQAHRQMHLVGPASDVYSLGATLHMLLTGQRRFDNSDVDHTIHRVAVGEFPRPRELLRSVPKALDAICMKALALEPSHRYASATDLADDIEHWLADEPVTAKKDSLPSRLARISRHNRMAMISGALALLLITTISIVAVFQINKERLRAEEEKLRADHQRQETEKVNARLALDRGLQLVTNFETGAGLLWFERALSLAPQQDVDLRRVILTNMNSARRDLLNRRKTYLRKHSAIVTHYCANGKRLLTCSKSGNLTLFDVDSGATLLELQLANATVVAASYLDERFALFVFLDDSNSLVIRKVDFEQSNASLGTPIHLSGVTKPSSIAFSPDQQFIAADSQRGGKTSILIWRLATGELVHDIPADSPVSELHFLKATQLISVGSNNQTRLWSIGSPKPKKLWSIDEAINRVAFPGVGDRLFTISNTGSLICWDHVNRRKLFSIPTEMGDVKSLACSSDGLSVAAAWATGIVRTWSVEDRRPASEVLRMDRYINTLKFRPNSRDLLVADDLISESSWTLPESNQFVPRLDQSSIAAVAFNAEGSLAVTTSRSFARIRDGVTGNPLFGIIKHKQKINRTLLCPDGSAVLTASEDGTARLWNLKDGSPIGDPILHVDASSSPIHVNAAAFSPIGNVFATGDSSGVIRLWNARDAQLELPPILVLGNVRSLCFSFDGQRLIVGYGPRETGICAIDATNGQLIWHKTQKDLEGHKEITRTVEFSPDGQVVISASNDRTARFWRASDGKPLGKTMVHRGQVFFAHFSPDSRLAVTGGFDSNVRLWRVPTGEPVGTLMQHDALVWDANFSPDGRRLLTGSIDQTARLWDVETCLPLAAPLKHSEAVLAARFHPTQNLALTTNRLWRLPDALPDNPLLVSRWVRLATERTLTENNSIQRIEPSTLEAEASEFEQLNGKAWQDWHVDP